nr:immunoglobulin light chain junction region [Macaca mulatta]
DYYCGSYRSGTTFVF